MAGLPVTHGPSLCRPWPHTQLAPQWSRRPAPALQLLRRLTSWRCWWPRVLPDRGPTKDWPSQRPHPRPASCLWVRLCLCRTLPGTVLGLPSRKGWPQRPSEWAPGLLPSINNVTADAGRMTRDWAVSPCPLLGAVSPSGGHFLGTPWPVASVHLRSGQAHGPGWVGVMVESDSSPCDQEDPTGSPTYLGGSRGQLPEQQGANWSQDGWVRARGPH